MTVSELEAEIATLLADLEHMTKAANHYYRALQIAKAEIERLSGGQVKA